ncbi:uncharacterized protein LOC143294213 isoform X2 [Babylonia areolata]
MTNQYQSVKTNLTSQTPERTLRDVLNMAATSDHVAARQNEAGRRRGSGKSGQEKMMPAPVEAVVQLGYPPDLVLFTYQRLLSARAHPSHHTATSPSSGSRDDAMTGNTPPPRAVSADTLLIAVDEAVRHSDVGSSGAGELGASAAMPLVAGGFQDGEGDTPSEEVQEDGGGDEAPSTLPTSSGPGQQPAGGNSRTPSSTDNLSSTDDQSESADNQASINHQPSTDNSESSVSSTMESSSSTTPAAASVSRDRSPGPAKPEEGAAAAADERASDRNLQLAKLRALRAENRRLKARQTCRQCRQRPVALTLLPCGHFCFCQECGSTLEKCPLCRKTILADVRTFVA